MKTSSKYIIGLGIAAAFVVVWATGVPLGTLMLVAAVLLCPAAMFFGMQRMRHGGDSGCERCEGEQDKRIAESMTARFNAKS